MEREGCEKEAEYFVLGEDELHLLEVPSFDPLVLLIYNVIILRTLNIWLSSDLISRQYSFINCEMRDLDRLFEPGQSRDLCFGDVELRIASRETFS